MARGSGLCRAIVPEINSAEGVTPTARASILVLDDDDGFRRFLVQALSGAGYSVVDSGDADAVLMILDGSVFFDLLITDIKTPLHQPRGIAVANMAMLKRRGIKIIYITGDPSQVALGFIDMSETPLLDKAIRLEVLLETVATVLAIAKRPIGAREPGPTRPGARAARKGGNGTDVR
jgi:DNA-binding NtrC family response regulator